jgi:ribonuclease HII
MTSTIVVSSLELSVELDPADAFARELGPLALVAGLDEVGRGPLAGPVVAAAVVLDPARPIEGMNDSKKLTPAMREALYPLILERAMAIGVGVVESTRIDEMNILRASLHAMELAFIECEGRLGRFIEGALLDGNQRAPLPARANQRTLIGGDGKCQAIMAASIVAKVLRDRRMVEEAERYPGYGFEKHKGYGTKQHQEALQKLGPTPLHRRSFAPVELAAQQLELGALLATTTAIASLDAMPQGALVE